MEAEADPEQKKKFRRKKWGVSSKHKKKKGRTPDIKGNKLSETPLKERTGGETLGWGPDIRKNEGGGGGVGGPQLITEGEQSHFFNRAEIQSKLGTIGTDSKIR